MNSHVCQAFSSSFFLIIFSSFLHFFFSILIYLPFFTFFSLILTYTSFLHPLNIIPHPHLFPNLPSPLPLSLLFSLLPLQNLPNSRLVCSINSWRKSSGGRGDGLRGGSAITPASGLQLPVIHTSTGKGRLLFPRRHSGSKLRRGAYGAGS